MDDTEAALEPETPTIETADTERPKEIPSSVDEVDSEPELDEIEASEPEFVEVQRNGKTFKVPKELEGELLMQSDYTKKTQTVAEKAKALESREAEINQRAEATEAELNARAQLSQVNSEIERTKAFTWAQYQQARQADPMGADEAWNYIQHMKAQQAELQGVIGKTQSERTQKAQQEFAKRVEDTKAFAQKEIPGWKPELTETLVKFAYDMGIPDQTLQTNWSPALYALLHKAHIGDLALKRQAAAPKTPKPAEPIAPLQTVTAKAQPAAKLSLEALAKAGRMDEYAAARKAGRVR